MKPDPCPNCGVNRNLVGSRHNCIPLRASPEMRVANSDTANLANAESVANASAHAPGRNRCSTTYRYRNPDKRRTYQRDLMRQRRASGRAA